MSKKIVFPAQFEQKIINLFQSKGRIWLDSLPNILLKLTKKWQLDALNPVDNLSYNYVCKGYSHAYTSKIVIKIGCDAQEISREVNALKFYRSNACVKLIDYDNNSYSILLEEVKPGHSLKILFPHEDELAIHYSAELIKKLHSNPIDHCSGFPKIEHWLEGLKSKNSDNITLNTHVEKAKILSLNLINSSRKPVFLHGDLHHDNILLNSESWVAINPKGVIGEAEYEVGDFIRNPHKELIARSDAKEIIHRRYEIFGRLLDLDQQRIKSWCYIQSVLAAYWAEGDDELYQQFVTLAEIIEHGE